MMAKKTLELNPHHTVMKTMLAKVKESVDGALDKETEDLATVLFNMAMLNSGFNIDSPAKFTTPLQKLINVGFGLDRDETVQEIELDIDLDEDEKKEDEEQINPDELEVEELDNKQDKESSIHDEL